MASRQLTDGYKKVLSGAVVAAVIGPVVLLGPAASANKASIHDRKRDAPKAIDVVRFRAKNKQHRIVFEFRGRKKKGYFGKNLRTVEGLAHRPGRKGPLFRVLIYRRNRADQGRFYFMKGKKYKKCKGIRSLPAKKRYRVRFYAPQKCFGEHAGKMQFSFITSKFNSKKSDHAPFTHTVKRG